MMESHWWWWGLAVVLALGEIFAGSLYLLVIAIGAGAAGAAALGGASLTPQLLIAAVVSLGGWGLLRRSRTLLPPDPTASDPSLQQDIGARVRVEHWGADGTARVRYRGSDWSARLRSPDARAALRPGDYRVCAVQGNWLVLEPIDMDSRD